MKLENAIKRIKKRADIVGRNVEIDIRDYHGNGQVKVYVHFEGAVSELSFWVNRDGHMGAPHIRRFNDHSDIHTDYFAGYHLDNLKQALDSLAPLPPKYAVGSLVQFKNSKRNQRWKLAGKVALVIQAESGGNYKVQYPGSEDSYNPFYSERDLELAA
jgi:hypothetical protein